MKNPAIRQLTSAYWRKLRAQRGNRDIPNSPILLRDAPIRLGTVAQLLHSWSPAFTDDRDLEVFASLIFVSPRSGCWIFRSADKLWDYPSFRVPSTGRWVTAHLWVYELLHGQVPEGLLVDHRCEVKRCVNPDHLQAITTPENARLSRVHRIMIREDKK